MAFWLTGGQGALVDVVAAALVAGLLGGEGETRSGSQWRFRGVARNASRAFLAVGFAAFLAAGLVLGPTGGLIAPLLNGLLYGLAGALAGALAGGPGIRPRHIAVVETLRWSFRRALLSGAVGLAGGLPGALVLVYAFAPAMDRASSEWVDQPAALAVALAAALAVGLVFGLAGGLAPGGVEEETKAVPNQGIHRSARAAVTLGLAFGLVGGLVGRLVFGLADTVPGGLEQGLGAGLAVGLAFGGYACLSHAALRFILWRNDALPLDCVRFLDYAAERVLLRKVGGGYLFVHRLLQEHFAALEADGDPAAPSPPAVVPYREPLPS